MIAVNSVLLLLWLWFSGFIVEFIAFKCMSVTGDWFAWSMDETPITYIIQGFIVNIVLAAFVGLLMSIF